jgi:hypothetical protein
MHRRWLTSIAAGALLVSGFAVGGTAGQLPPPDPEASRAALYLLGSVFGLTAILQKCGEVNGIDKEAYAAVLKEFVDAHRALVTRLETIVEQESLRGGKSLESGKDEIRLGAGQAVAATERRWTEDPGYFTAKCLALPDEASRRTGPFRPFDEQDPKRMVIINNWH